MATSKQVPEKMDTRKKVGIWLVAAPSAAIIATSFLYSMIHWALSTGMAGQAVGIIAIIVNVLLFIIGVIAVISWVPALIVGIVLLANPKK